YGKPISELPRYLQIPFRRFNFVFLGKTKKIAYAHAMDGKEMLPIQGITSVIYLVSGLAGTYLFLEGRFMLSFLITLATTQIWRVVSEFFRADYRGEGWFSTYQIMSLISVVYAVTTSLLLTPRTVTAISILRGLETMWSTPVILFLQGLWLAIFIFTGRSKIITAELSFHVQTENI
ncbi:MAG: prolipoprotein diacylglyceryl transferase, partial [bacterium]